MSKIHRKKSCHVWLIVRFCLPPQTFEFSSRLFIDTNANLCCMLNSAACAFPLKRFQFPPSPPFRSLRTHTSATFFTVQATSHDPVRSEALRKSTALPSGNCRALFDLCLVLLLIPVLRAGPHPADRHAVLTAKGTMLCCACQVTD